MNQQFNAVIASEVDGIVAVGSGRLSHADLPDNDVLVQIDYSTLNYKDALAITGKGKICRRLPMVCGIDLAGTVVESSTASWQAGDKVVLNGFGMSETRWGGYSQYQRVPSECLVRLPEAFDTEQAMAIGTAGYTAMLCVMAVQKHGVRPQDGSVLVTGASGGVGSYALMLLKKLGYTAVAVSGRRSTFDYLRSIGASSVIAREELDRAPRPLEKEAWAAGIDSVGGKTLASLLAQTHYEGIVAACGLAGGIDLPSSVMPFILRGVTLRGIDSVMANIERRQEAWSLLGQLLDQELMTEVYRVEPMSRIKELADDLLNGRLVGRVVIDVNT